MKYHWSLKFLALVLAALSGAVAILACLGVAVNLNNGYYEEEKPTSYAEQELENELADYAYVSANTVAAAYEKSSSTDLGYRRIWAENFNTGWDDGYYWPECEYTIFDQEGKELKSTVDESVEYARELTMAVNCETGKIIRLGTQVDYPAMDELTPDYVWYDDNGKKLDPLDSRTVWYYLYWYDTGVYRVEKFEDAVYDVHIYLTKSDLAYFSDSMEIGIAEQMIYDYRVALIWTACIALCVCLLCVVYVCFAAGHKGGSDEIVPAGLNRLPLDLYAVGGVLAMTGLGVLFVEALRDLVSTSQESYFNLMLALAAALAALEVLVAVLALMALCAQVKEKTWLKKTVIGRCLLWALGLVKRMLAWLRGKLGTGSGLLSGVGRMLRELYGMLPLVWQWVAIGGLLMILLACCGTLVGTGAGIVYWMMVVICLIAVFYTANHFGKLRTAAKKMAQGDLNAKLDVSELDGCFKEFGEHLNMLGDVCVEAARKQMKSERMKSELITNVSHDIKTPLTSIINYVDLLQRAETEQQRNEYLEVLDRQSQKLKKLIDDLMEMSKASSGNVAVELARTDVTEAVTQALGEYADAMEAIGLNVVVHKPDEDVMAMCDGKLLWRVMANVLGNVVKYSLPNTRVYVDVAAREDKVTVSVKNISREELNISAGELMERFVRGDASRNTDGSGLGLNIAKGLMEAQGGQLELVVDGDLFKVTLTLNGA